MKEFIRLFVTNKVQAEETMIRIFHASIMVELSR